MPKKVKAKKSKNNGHALQRPFYKGVGYKKKAATIADSEKRFVNWVCPPDMVCTPKEEQPLFTENIYWRIFRIMAEFIDGFEFLSKLKREVTIFGSARVNPRNKYYKQAVTLGRLCAESGYTVITGGGPGIMEAGNKGASLGGGTSVGIDIELPHEQRRNPFVTHAIGFHYFFTRKVMLSASAQAYVFFPGGFGTMDEALEMITLVQTGKIPKNVPCIFMDREHWGPFVDWIREYLYKRNKFILKKDVDLFQVVDTPEEAFEIIKKTTERDL